ncbi:curli-like amyloid fiber formation chaperone CsgH [Actibacterium sp. MT2.3-13A]|uniref:curli-like amyloid fiber formation chaperone CsgH n=1 Tax=Actibacterium sp. MT2.3-13A TaxID=2828332 RepID=UPI001BAB6280|nr:curli-like amyloid fiber formation chaperone CsgH [Actibacterium sp. MT2.3-13A]
MSCPFPRSAWGPALIALALTGAMSPPGAGRDAAPLSCRIATGTGAQGVTLEARAMAGAQGAEGLYSLEVTRNGASGSTAIRQGGDFSLRAGETAVLGQVTLGPDPRGYAARLVLRWDGNEISCAAPGGPGE